MRVGTGSETDARDAETLVVGLSLAGGPVTLRLLWAVVVGLLAGLDPLLGAVCVGVLRL